MEGRSRRVVCMLSREPALTLDSPYTAPFSRIANCTDVRQRGSHLPTYKDVHALVGLSPIPPLNELVPQLLEMLVGKDPERSFVDFQCASGGSEKDQVVLLVNNLGGLSELEMGGIVSQVCADVEARGMMIRRVLSGSFMVSGIVVTQA